MYRQPAWFFELCTGVKCEKEFQLVFFVGENFYYISSAQAETQAPPKMDRQDKGTLLCFLAESDLNLAGRSSFMYS